MSDTWMKKTRTKRASTTRYTASSTRDRCRQATATVNRLHEAVNGQALHQEGTHLGHGCAAW